MCELCDAAYKNGRPSNFGSDPVCGFKKGIFTSENWCCRTLTELRRIAYSFGDIHESNDKSLVHIADPDGGWIVLSFYNDSGHIGTAVYVTGKSIDVLTEEKAREVLEFYAKRSRSGYVPSKEVLAFYAETGRKYEC